ncbi:MAG: methyltransferase domain-containing protein [Pseudomonadota bacterium]|nr:methyltransferase domain-containing protein [Pseudomonadota bacterium]
MTEIWQGFDRAATHYDQLTPLQQQSAIQLLQRLGTVPPNQVWMDAGCGTGRLAKALAAQHVRVWAVDRALAMLQPLRSLENIQIICTDLRELPMPDEMLDGMVSNFALHWLGVSVLPELLRVVRPSGELHLAIPVSGSLSAVHARYPDLPIFNFASAQAWIDAAGDALVAANQQVFRQPYADLRALLTALKHMGGAQLAADQAHVSAMQLRQWLRDPEPIELDYQVLFLHLKKPTATDGFSQWLQQVQRREG